MKGIKKLFGTKTLRNRFFIIAALSAILTAYLVFIVHYYICYFEWELNPISIVKQANSTGKSPFALALICAAVIIIFVLLRMVQNVNAALVDDRGVVYSKDGTYGTARPGTTEDAKKYTNVRPVDACLGMIFGQEDEKGRKCLEMKPERFRINRNVGAFGAAGSGKSYSVIEPAIYQAIKRGESIISADTKGAVHNATVELGRKNGYEVKIFNLKEPTRSHGWDCLKEILDEDGNIDSNRASTFADAVIRNTSLRNESSIFSAGPLALLKSVCLFVLSSPMFGDPPKKPRSFASAYQMILDNDESSLDQLFSETECCDAARDAYKTYKQTSPNLRGNILSNLGTSLHTLADPNIRMLTSFDEIDMTRPAKKKCLYYIIVPDYDRTYDFYTALFITFLFIDLMRFADKQKDQRCPVPVNFILDEFANLGVLPDFDQKISTVRSRDITIMFACQDLDQLKRLYPETWNTILNNCSFQLGVGFNDPETEQRFSDRSGISTIQTVTEQHPVKRPLIPVGLRHSTGAGKRQVLTPDELARLGEDRALLVVQNCNPIVLNKFPKTLHPYYKLCSPASGDDFPRFVDVELRRLVIDLEEERVRQFDAWYANNCEGEKPPVLPLPEIEAGKYTLEQYREMCGGDSLVVENITWVETEVLSTEETDVVLSDYKQAETETAISVEDDIIEDSVVNLTSEKNPQKPVIAAAATVAPSTAQKKRPKPAESNNSLPKKELSEPPAQIGNISQILSAKGQINAALAAAMSAQEKGKKPNAK